MPEPRIAQMSRIRLNLRSLWRGVRAIQVNRPYLFWREGGDPPSSRSRGTTAWLEDESTTLGQVN
jgi:hypothetical protein